MVTLVTIILLFLLLCFIFPSQPPPSRPPFIPLVLIFILLSYSFYSLVCFLYYAPVNLHLMSFPGELEFPGWSDHNTTGPRFCSLGSCSIFLWLDPFSPPLIVVGFVLTPQVDPRAEQSETVCQAGRLIPQQEQESSTNPLGEVDCGIGLLQ